jgi:hypothetical protein
VLSCSPEDELPAALDETFEYPETGEVFRVSLILSKKGEVKAKSIGRSKSPCLFSIQLIVPWIARCLGLGNDASSSPSDSD